MSLQQWVRPEILAMAGYVPGEQPAPGRSFIKLNTNENPYPPPRPVLEAIAANADQRLRLYPEPSSRPVREAAARAYGLHPDHVVAGNGSDDLLTMILRTFVGPGERVAAPGPTYSLYPELTHLQGGVYVESPWLAEGGLPVAALAEHRAKVTFVTRPNAPTGHVVPLSQVAELCQATAAFGVVVLDEAYVDFAEDHGLGLLVDHPNLLVTRSFSKSFCLAGLRIGLGFMSAELAGQMHKVRDSYNLDRLAQAAAEAALGRLDLYAPLWEAVRLERRRVSEALRQRGFTVGESQANFVLAAIPPGRLDGAGWTGELKNAGILVRYFAADPRLRDRIRITIGLPEEMDRLLDAVDGLLAGSR
ncbi:MAG: histidinol-phosphate transaminase [Magnetococcales bacterium]|nr:histidinol-phosphate transaminase [Magnetococcales bacterium]